jgi:hypothetical protein
MSRKPEYARTNGSRKITKKEISVSGVSKKFREFQGSPPSGKPSNIVHNVVEISDMMWKSNRYQKQAHTDF